MAAIKLAGMLAWLFRPTWMAWSSLSLPLWLRWTGVGLGALTIGLLIWTFRTLGPNLTDTVVTRREHSLVTTGPYRWVRHPIYTAILSFMAGVVVIGGSWFGVAAFGLLLGLLIVKASWEEKRLIEVFPGYPEYRTKTGQFVPRVGRK